MKCGVGAYTQRLAESLAELADVRVTVLTDTRAGGTFDRDAVAVLPVIHGWSLRTLMLVANYVRRLAPDVVHIQYPTQGYSGKIPTMLPLLMRLLGKRCIQTWHEPVLGRGAFWLSLGLDALITVREELLPNIPEVTRRSLDGSPLSWIPSASILPTMTLHGDERSKIRQQYVTCEEKLLGYYGFVAPLKGIEVLLDIIAKTDSRLVMACDLQSNDEYHRSLLNRIESMGIGSRITIAGFLPGEQLATLLAAADAVVLPFRDGAKDCNTSIDGAVAQGTFVLTTSVMHSGYNNEKNIYYAMPGNVDEMITAIEKYSGHRNPCMQPRAQWRNIAEQHLKIYTQVVTA